MLPHYGVGLHVGSPCSAGEFSLAEQIASAKSWRTENDLVEWQTWRKERALELQRGRRRMLWRIDYYPDRKAARILAAEAERRGSTVNYHEILNRIICEWDYLPKLNSLE